MNVTITGASGFLGSRLMSCLSSEGVFTITGLSRKYNESTAFNTKTMPELGKNSNWTKLLIGQDVVIHTAGRAHVLKEAVSSPWEEYLRVNVRGSVEIAEAAGKVGVKRFIYISSVKVNGESTLNKRPFRFSDRPAPEDCYGRSKLLAEEELKRLSKLYGFELVIIRPPLIYGPEVKANFLSLVKLAESGIPLPFKGVHNSRSFVYLDNLVSLISTCVTSDAASGNIFLVSDGFDMSLPDLLLRVGNASGKKVRLFPIPSLIFKLLSGFPLVGKRVTKITDSLQVNIDHTCKTLNWKPPFSVDEGLQSCFRSQQSPAGARMKGK